MTRHAATIALAGLLSCTGLSAALTIATDIAPASANPANGSLFAWGTNTFGELGVGENTGPQNCGSSSFPTPCSTSPVQTLLPTGVTATAAAAGTEVGYALGSDGNVYGWGANGGGQLGNGTTADTSTPTRALLPGGVSADAIAAGSANALAIGSDGHLYSWGNNSQGELGNGTTNGSTTPVQVLLPAGVSANMTAAGPNTAFAAGSDGLLYMWGDNSSGQQSCRGLPCSTTPVVVSLPAGATATTVVGSDFFGLVIGSDSILYQIASSTNAIPMTLPGGTTPTAIASGFSSFYAAGSDGHLYAWGPNNDSGQLGNGTTTASSTPVQVLLPTGVHPTSISANYYSAYAVGSDGHLYSWGDNDSGQLGIGNNTGPTTACGFPCSTTPIQVSLPAGQVPLALGPQGQAIRNGYVITAPAAPVTISGTPPSPVSAWLAYHFAFTLGGLPAPTTTVTAGSPPPGLTLSSSGVLSGTPITAGRYAARVTAANGISPNATGTFTIVVKPTLTITPNSGPPGAQVTVNGTGFKPGESVVAVYGTRLASPHRVTICSANVAADGTFTCTGSVPTGTSAGPLGTHRVLAQGSRRGSVCRRRSS